MEYESGAGIANKLSIRRGLANPVAVAATWPSQGGLARPTTPS